jgi:hypothetical protein
MNESHTIQNGILNNGAMRMKELSALQGIKKHFAVVFCLSQIILLLNFSNVHSQSVDLLTGNLQYGIPLGAASANDISIPVGISQHGNALTVAEGEGDCGMGWSLSAGGAITRVVRGLPDEVNSGTRIGWLHLGSTYSSIQNFSPSGNDALDVCSDEASDFTFLDGLAYSYDTEPDLFFFDYQKEAYANSCPLPG